MLRQRYSQTGILSQLAFDEGLTYNGYHTVLSRDVTLLIVILQGQQETRYFFSCREVSRKDAGATESERSAWVPAAIGIKEIIALSASMSSKFTLRIT